MNIVQLPGTKAKMSLETKRELLVQVREEMPWMLEYAQVAAEIAAKKFKILLANGFTEAQALELLRGSV